MTKFKTGLELQKPLLILSIGDIIETAKRENIKLTDQQLEQIFHDLDASDPIMEAFWIMLELKIEAYRDANRPKCENCLEVIDLDNFESTKEYCHNCINEFRENSTDYFEKFQDLD